MTTLSTAEGVAILGATGILLFLLYTSVSRWWPSEPTGPSLWTRFDQTPQDESWFPSRLPVEPDGNVFYTDEERVIRLLIAHQGRMQQSKIVSETGWSSAKVSRLLHRMENRADVSRVPAGRSKVVYLGHYQTDDTPTRDETDEATHSYLSWKSPEDSGNR